MRKPQICICDEGVLGDVVSRKRFPFRSRAACGSESSLLVELEPGTTPALLRSRAPQGGRGLVTHSWRFVDEDRCGVLEIQRVGE